MGRLARFFALPGAKRRLFLRALGRLALNVCRVRFLPSRPWEKSPSMASPTVLARMPADMPTVDDIVWATTTAARCVPGASCLVQAITGWSMLQEAGYPASLHVGVAKGEKVPLQAHAWIESEGRVLIGASEAKFHTLRYSDGSTWR